MGQGYVSYEKALHVLLSLRDMIGEDKVNKVLKTLTDRYRDSAQLQVTTLDFLDEVYSTPQMNNVYW